jgi:hypothetical protein
MSGKLKGPDWANYNGAGKPITEKQFHQIMSEGFGIEPVQLEDGKWGCRREQFEEAWRVFLPRQTQRR